jgi:putative transcriptional regulator
VSGAPSAAAEAGAAAEADPAAEAGAGAAAGAFAGADVAAGAAAGEEAGHGSAIRIRLDELLAERGLTLTELSDRVGITVVNLSVLKNGRARAIRFSTLARLCQALGCQPGDLLSYRPASPSGPGASPARHG